MSLTPEESKQVEALLPPIGEFKGLFSGKPRVPREVPTVFPKDARVPFSKYVSGTATPAVAPEESGTVLREEALKAGYIALGSVPTSDLVTMERAVLRYGQDVAEEQHLARQLIDHAETGIEKLLDSARPSKVVDPATLSVAVLALTRMEQAVVDPAQQEAVTKAFEAIPKDPEELELLRRQALLGHDTGEIVVRAIVEHEPLSA